MSNLIKHRTITEGNNLYQFIIKVKPIALHYELENEPPYLKYRCRVCVECGFSCASLAGDETNCPVCGINLDWEDVS